MCDMYEVLDRWGAWAAAENSGVDWQPVVYCTHFVGR